MKCFLFAIVPHRKISSAFHFSWANVSIIAKNLVPIKSVHRNLLGLFQCSLTKEWIASVDWKTIISFGWQTRSWWQYNCVLFSRIAFNFHQIYPQSCSQTRIHRHTYVRLGKIVANSKQKHHAFDPNRIFRLLASVKQWENMPNIQTTNLQLVLISFVLFLSTMPKMCYLQRAHPPLVPIWMELKWNQNGFIRLFFSHRTHITYICMCMCVCYEALLDCRKVVYVENVLSLCCMHKRWL